MREHMSSNLAHLYKRIVSCCSLVFLLCLLLPTKAMAGSETLLIGPGDQLHIQVLDTPEMEQTPRVTDAGTIPVEGVGSVKVAGLTPAQAETVIQNGLIAARYMRHPVVQVTVTQYATQNVSVLGEVKAPGPYPIGTPRSILDLLALAGGLSQVADRNILIERHGDPADLVHYYYSNDADKAVEDQVEVNPGDTVIVPKAGIVYILGDVNRPGGYAMVNNQSQMTALEALALAGGLTKTAKEGHARLIRKLSGGTYSDRTLSVGDLQKGKTPDFAMLPGDVLYVPFSFGKNLAVFGSANIVGSAASAAVYAVP